MKKYFLFLTLILFWFLGIDCKDDPPLPPCIDCPTPLDTTSHDFVWTIDTLGDASSQLNDVAIINDTTIFCVGQIFLNDSMGQVDPINYNFAKWDGKKWIILRIPLQLYNSDCTVAGSYYGTLRTIFAFHDGKVIMTDGADVVLSNDFSYSHLSCSNSAREGGFIKFWGVSLSNLYAVGHTGTICFFNGNSWQKIESGTTLPIQDIWGSTDTKTGKTEILAVASNKFFNEGRKLLQISNLTAISIADSGLPWSLSSLWFEANQAYYIVGDGLFKKSSLTSDSLWKSFHRGLTTYYTNTIRANNRNDIVIVGAFGNFLHYNGSTWKSYMGNELPAIDGSYYSVAIKNNLVVAVGYIGDRGVVVMGKRK